MRIYSDRHWIVDAACAFRAAMGWWTHYMQCFITPNTHWWQRGMHWLLLRQNCMRTVAISGAYNVTRLSRRHLASKTLNISRMAGEQIIAPSRRVCPISYRSPQRRPSSNDNGARETQHLNCKYARAAFVAWFMKSKKTAWRRHGTW